MVGLGVVGVRKVWLISCGEGGRGCRVGGVLGISGGRPGCGWRGVLEEG